MAVRTSFVYPNSPSTAFRLFPYLCPAIYRSHFFLKDTSDSLFPPLFLPSFRLYPASLAYPCVLHLYLTLTCFASPPIKLISKCVSSTLHCLLEPCFSPMWLHSPTQSQSLDSLAMQPSLMAIPSASLTLLNFPPQSSSILKIPVAMSRAASLLPQAPMALVSPSKSASPTYLPVVAHSSITFTRHQCQVMVTALEL